MSQKTTFLELYLIRHGATEWSENGRHTGTTDLPLTDLGKKQSELLKKRLSQEKFSKIFCSPLNRALETCKLCGYDPMINPDLREWNYGEYEGLTTQQIREKNPTWNIFENGAPGGESPQEIASRAHHFLHQVHSLEGNVRFFPMLIFYESFNRVVRSSPAFGK